MERKGKEREGRWKERAPKEERDAACWEVKLQRVSLGRQGEWENAARPSWREGRKTWILVDEVPPPQGSGAELRRRAQARRSRRRAAEKGVGQDVTARKRAGEASC